MTSVVEKAHAWIGKRVKRNEDPRLLTGQGTYVDDIHRPNMLHGAFLRSPYARALVLSIQTENAKTLPGVVAIYTYDDLSGGARNHCPLLIPNPDLRPKTAYPLANGEVKHVGEPVAFVVAESRYIAEDAVDLIEVEYEMLDPVADMEKAILPQSPKVHAEIPDNLSSHKVQHVGNVEEGFAAADLIFEDRFVMDRGHANPMETRGIVAQYSDAEGLTMWDSTQAPIRIKNGMADILGIPEHFVRVIAPNVGGGFGPKVMMFYPEEIVLGWSAVQLKRAIKWIEDRREHFVATSHERLQIYTIKVGVKKDGTITALDVSMLHEDGAYVPYGLIVPLVATTTLPGPYKLQNYRVEFRAVYTNKTLVSPYRGAGRPHGVFVMERTINRIARELNMDPVEVRMRNFVRPDEFPYDVGIIYQDGAMVRYDSGNYQECVRVLLKALDYENFPARQAEARRQGKYLGVGIGCYVEGSGVGPYEGARCHIDSTGKVLVATGVGTQGQSHYTVLAQIAAEELGVDVTDVHVVTGDTGVFSWGTGTFASRAAVVAGNAVHRAARAVRERCIRIASRLLSVPEDQLTLGGGRVYARANPEKGLTLKEVAAGANPMRGVIPEDYEGPGLEVTRYYAPPQGAFAFGAHGAVVEVDIETGFIRYDRYVIVHDCGTVINPMVVEGQILGGLAQGIGGSFYEKLVYDENAQLLTTTFMDYLLPTASEVPMNVEIHHVETPSPLNPLGVKGVGEAGVIPVPAVTAEAIDSALSHLGVVVKEMPLSPAKLASLINGRKN